MQSISNHMAECMLLNIPDTYQIVPMQMVKLVSVSNYFQDLSDANLINLRFPDIEDGPNKVTICAEEVYKQHHSYVVVNCCTQKIVSEVHLAEFSGKSAKIHFSQHPTNTTKLNRYLAKAITDCILNVWTFPGIKYNSFLDTLIGVTPSNNRAACLYVLRSGFTKLGIIPNCIDYLGVPANAMISFKTRRENYGK